MKCSFIWNVLVITVVCCIFTLPVPALAGLSAYDIVKKSEDLLDQAKDSKVVMTMTLVNKKGDQRERRLSAFTKREGEKKSKSVLFFNSPCSAACTSDQYERERRELYGDRTYFFRHGQSGYQ